MMKNKYTLWIVGSLLLVLSIAGHLSAQTNSAGCDAWDGLATNTLTNPNVFSLNNQPYDAGDIVTATFSLNTATTASVTLESPLNTVRDNATFTSGSVTLLYTIPTDGTYTISVRNTGASNGSVNVSFACTPVPVTPPVVPPVPPATGSSANNIMPTIIGFTDARINFRDAAAPIAIYAYVDSSGRGFEIYHADGRFAYRATAEDLQGLPLYDPINDIRILAVAGGGYRITAPQYNDKTYVMEVDAPYAHIGYTSWEQE